MKSKIQKFKTLKFTVLSLLRISCFEFRASERQRGFTLFYAVLISSLLLAIGLAIFNITFKEVILSSGARESANAFYAADTGLECALYWDLKHAGISSPAFGFYGDSLASGLIGYWRFEDGTGSLTAVDSSGHGNLGTLTNMDANTAWVTGKIGNALMFDGIDDGVTLPDIDYTSEMSGSVWVKFTTITPQQMIIAQGLTPEVQLQMQGATNGNKFRIRVDAGGGADIIDSSGPAVAGSWYHIVWTYDGTNVKLYINDTQETNFVQNTGSGNIADINVNYSIGSRNNTSLPASAIIDDVRLYNRALTTTEIQKLGTSPYSNLQFVQPIQQNTPGVNCLGTSITNPVLGWDTTNGWTVATTTTSATTTFDMLFVENGRCATVQVVKNAATTSVVSRGYNNCTLTDPRRVERAIKASY